MTCRLSTLVALVICLTACERDATPDISSTPPVEQPATPSTVDVWQDTSMTEPLAEQDPRTKDLQPYFVTAQKTSLCPSIQRAMARECGHSIEFGGETGYRVTQGERVFVVAGEHDPRATTLPVIRYMVQGLTPGYVAREDISLTPDMSHRDAFLDTLSITSTHAASKLTQEQLEEVLTYTGTEGLIHITGVKPEGMTHAWRGLEGGLIGFDLRLDDSAPAVVVDFPIDMEEFLFPAFMDEEYFPEVPHRYTCDERYCDEIDLIFTSQKGQPAQILHVIDRFGTHTLRAL